VVTEIGGIKGAAVLFPNARERFAGTASVSGGEEDEKTKGCATRGLIFVPVVLHKRIGSREPETAKRGKSCGWSLEGLDTVSVVEEKGSKGLKICSGISKGFEDWRTSFDTAFVGGVGSLSGRNCGAQ
jgi:hypothetical protein